MEARITVEMSVDPEKLITAMEAAGDQAAAVASALETPAGVELQQDEEE